MFGLFNRKKKVLLVEKMIDLLGCDKLYLHNGYTVGWSGSGVTNEEMHSKGAIKLGIGEVVSGFGDWGGGFSKSRSYACQIWIDKDFNILNVKFHSFYNSPDGSKLMERKAKEYFGKNDFKKVHMNPESNAYKRLIKAFEESAGKMGSITHDEFKYSTVDD